MILRMKLSVGVLLLLITCTNSAKTYVERDPTLTGEAFLSCVEVVDVWPPPNSVLELTGPVNGLFRITFKVTFSRPVFIETEDTTAGLHPGISESYVRQWRPTKVSFASIGRFSPIFLSHSQTQNFNSTYSPTRITNWDGSDRIFLAIFDLAKEFTLLLRFYLVIDGGRFYAFDNFMGMGLQRTYTPLSVFGEFFFSSEDAGSKKPQSIQPSPYCWQTPRQTYSVSQEGVADPSLSEDGVLAVELVDGSHRLELSNQGVLTLQLSLLTRGAEGEASIKLPPTVTANYNGANITIKLPSWTATYGNRASSPSILVPVHRKLVFDLREQIYHSTSYKVATMPQRPAFANAYLPSFLIEASPQLPKLRMGHYSSSAGKFINFELYEPVTETKLAEYFPIVTKPGTSFQHPLYDLISHMPRLKPYKWATFSRTASIYSKPRGNANNFMYEPQYTIPNINLLENKKFETDNSRQCPLGTRGNVGRRGKLEHVVEKGPYYHLLIPRDKSLWTSSATDVTNWAYYVDENGERKQLNEQSDNSESVNYIPRAVSEGLARYVCMLRPVYPLVGTPSAAGDVYEQWIPLDECIFVPREVAESRVCGGLMLFTNVANITSDPNFCSKKFGDCVGLPFSSKQRFPIIPTYGVEELTGWLSCGANCNQNLAKFAHPVGRHELRGNIALPRASLVIAKTRMPDMSLEEELTLWLTPLTHSSSETQHTLSISGDDINVLEPVLANVNDVIAVEGESFCEDAWTLEGRTLSLASTNKMETVLSATVYNIGEGGGRFAFEVKCSDQLVVSPSSSNITKWLPPAGSVVVEYRLSGELVPREAEKKHKCEMTISVEAVPGYTSQEQSVHCTALVVTYYGAFDDPCKLPEPPLPNVDVQYWVLPNIELKMELGLEDFLRSPVGTSLVFVRAITIVLDIPPEEKELLCIVHELEVKCLSAEIILVREDQLLYEASRSRQNHAHRLAPEPLLFHSDITSKKKVYFFATTAWADSQQDELEAMTSQCTAAVWAYRPNWLCTQRLEEIVEVRIPLGSSDVTTVVEENKDVFQILTPIYGEQSRTILAALLLCIAATLVLMVSTALGHGVMFALRKKMPKKDTLKSIKKDIEKMKRADKKYWDNPQVFLLAGPHGPYHVLHQFRATDSLNAKDIKNLKIIGMLRYKTKELQVMFGHVKKIFVDRGGTTDVWLQASSGMYLLQRQNVVEDYQVQFDEFLLSSGVTVENPRRAPPLTSHGTDGNKAVSKTDNEKAKNKTEDLIDFEDTALPVKKKKKGTESNPKKKPVTKSAPVNKKKGKVKVSRRAEESSEESSDDSECCEDEALLKVKGSRPANSKKMERQKTQKSRPQTNSQKPRSKPRGK